VGRWLLLICDMLIRLRNSHLAVVAVYFECKISGQRVKFAWFYINTWLIRDPFGHLVSTLIDAGPKYSKLNSALNIVEGPRMLTTFQSSRIQI
jgi:hypothetical protein